MKNSNGYSADKDIFVTWQDFTKRMQATTVSEADWNAFYRRYEKYTVFYCRKHYPFADSEAIEAILYEMCFTVFNDEKLREFERQHDIQGSFRAWLKFRIKAAATKVFRKLNKNKEISIESMDKMLFDDPDDDEKLKQLGTTSQEEEDDNTRWRHYVAFLALDEVRQKASENPIQFQSFINVVYNGKKPAELAELLGITSLQISENVRAIKNKLKTALKNMEEKYPIEDIDKFDWQTFKKDADNAIHELDVAAQAIRDAK